MMVTFKEACKTRDRLQAEMQAASDALNAFPKSGPMNLTPDEVKFSAEFQQANARYQYARQSLRRFNATFCKVFDKELRAERDEKRAAKLAESRVKMSAYERAFHDRAPELNPAHVETLARSISPNLDSRPPEFFDDVVRLARRMGAQSLAAMHQSETA